MKTLNIYNTLLITIFTTLLCVNIHAQTVSNFSTGTTFTEHTFKTSLNDPNTVDRGEDLLLNSTKIVNQHLMGFGADNPEKSPDNYDFRTIKSRIGNNTRLGNEAEVVVLTACCAPDWMKGGSSDSTDWSKIEVAPFPQHFDDYAELVAELVKRPEYSNIKYVQVWNEMKGFWHPTEDRWNYEAYIDLYNQVYDAVDAVRPDIKIGGPYVAISVYGDRQTAQWKCNDWNMELIGNDSWGYFDCRDLQVIEQWLQGKQDADFIIVDATIANKDNVYTTDVDEFKRTERFGAFMEWLRGLNSIDARTLPVWWGEWYAEPSNPNASQQEKNALMATALIRIIKSGASTALLWGPQGDTNGNMLPLALFTDTRVSGGGQETIFHTTQKYLYDHFSAGTTLIDANTDNANIEVLASNDKTLLVNTSGTSQAFTFHGLTLSLEAYKVQLIDTPRIGGGDDCNLLTNGDFSNGITEWFDWRCTSDVVLGACQITNIRHVQKPWKAALAQGNLTLEQGKQYEVSFNAASIHNNRTIKVKVGTDENSSLNYHYPEIPLTPDNERFTLTFIMSHPTTTKGRLEFHLGTNTTGLVLDNIRLKPVNEGCIYRCEQVKNGHFKNGLTNWQPQECTVTYTNYGVNVGIESASSNFWDIALKQRGLTYEQGKEYRVSFQAKADAERIIRVKATGESNGDYKQYHLQKIDLSTHLEDHAFTFTMRHGTDTNAFLEFFFGNSAVDLYLANISVVETECVGLREDLSNETITHYKIFPNPTNDILNVSLNLADDYDKGIIRLFDLNGRTILEEEKALSTTNQFQLNIQAIPTGMYMLRVDVGGYFVTDKVVKY